MEGTRTCGRQSDTTVDWMTSNDVEYERVKKRPYDGEDWRHGGLSLADKVEHSRENM